MIVPNPVEDFFEGEWCKTLSCTAGKSLPILQLKNKEEEIQMSCLLLLGKKMIHPNLLFQTYKIQELQELELIEETGQT
jgi:hypothetical protein